MRINYLTGILLIMFACMSCNQKKSSPASEDGSNNLAGEGEIRFEKLEHNLGRVLQGETVGYNFAFTNTGEGSIMILNASASCGCTVPRFSKEPIPPGGSGTVEVMFDSSGRMGRQSKSVNLKTNGKPGQVQLIIKANIVDTN